MNKKWYKLIVMSASLFTLAACGQSNDSVSYSDGSSESGQEQPIVESESSKDTLNAEEDTEKSSEADTSQATDGADSSETYTAEEQSIIDQPVPQSATGDTSVSSSVASSGVASSETTSDATSEEETQSYDNTRAKELMAEAMPLIHQASDNMFKAEGYLFTPILLNDNLVQVEIRKQSPDGQNHENLITIYRYDSEHGHLMEQNVVNANWENVTPE